MSLVEFAEKIQKYRRCEMKKILTAVLILLVSALAGCGGGGSSSSGGGGGGDTSITISGTASPDGTTLVIRDLMPTGKILWGPTVIGTAYSANFAGIVTTADMRWSKIGCKDDVAGIAVRPGSKISGINASLICG